MQKVIDEINAYVTQELEFRETTEYALEFSILVDEGWDNDDSPSEWIKVHQNYYETPFMIGEKRFDELFTPAEISALIFDTWFHEGFFEKSYQYNSICTSEKKLYIKHFSVGEIEVDFQELREEYSVSEWREVQDGVDCYLTSNGLGYQTCDVVWIATIQIADLLSRAQERLSEKHG